MTGKNNSAVQERAVAMSLVAIVTFIFGFDLTRLPLRITAEPLPTEAEIYFLPNNERST